MIEIKGDTNTLSVSVAHSDISKALLIIENPNGSTMGVHVSRAELIRAVWPEGIEALRDSTLEIEHLYRNIGVEPKGDPTLAKVEAALSILEQK